MNTWDKVIPNNSSLRLIHECVKRNHYVAITTTNDMGIRDSVTTANCKILIQGQKVSTSFKAFRKKYQRHKERRFSELLKFWHDRNDLVSLLVSKTSTGFCNTIVDIIERNIVEKPQYITWNFENPQIELNNQLFDYILSGLK